MGPWTRAWQLVTGLMAVVLMATTGHAENAACPALVFTSGQDVCYRLTATNKASGPFDRKGPPTRADREEAERWLLSYPACESFLNEKISQLEAEIQQAANAAAVPAAGMPTAGQIATCKLGNYQGALASAQIDRHESYNIIHDELHEELDYKLWREQIMLTGTVLGGAGGARDIGLDLRWDSRKVFPAGFRSSLSIGLHGTSNLLYQAAGAGNQPSFNDLPTPRDSMVRLSIPVLGGLSWSWIASSIFIAGGAAWTSSASSWTAVGQIGIGFLQNWVHNDIGNSAGPATELRFVIQPWVPIYPQQQPTSILFGLELGAGVGFIRSPCNPEQPTEDACPRLTTR